MFSLVVTQYQLFFGKESDISLGYMSVYEKLSDSFVQIIENPNEMELLNVITFTERYVVLLYNRSNYSHT